MRIFFLLLGYFFCMYGYGQAPVLAPITHSDFLLNCAHIDSNANSFVIVEMGKTKIDLVESDHALRVIHDYVIRILIKDQEGFDQANFSLPLFKYGNDFETAQSIEAKTYNFENGSITESPVKTKEIFTENKTPFVKLTKFTLPNIRINSIIEVKYTIISPNLFNFRSWEFQSNLPKLTSSYTAIIPALYKYNVTLRGTLPLTDTKTEILRECFRVSGAKADCSQLTYWITNIPAFEEEDFMLASKNYKSSINFELEEMQTLRGAKQSFTKKWSDVDRELMTEKDFGGQIKKAKIFKEILPDSISSQTDPVQKAKMVYNFIQKRIKWNNFYGKYGQYGVEESLSKGFGNVGDINLSYIAALQAVNIEAYPILVSTRENGLPNPLHPILSDFDYVIVGIKLNNGTVLSDATETHLPFGDLPLRCVNERGRIIFSRKSSEWIALVNKTKSITNYSFSGKLAHSGTLTGILSISYNGLDAVRKRKEISSSPTVGEYAEKIDENWANISISNTEIHNLTKLDEFLIEEFEVEISIMEALKPNTQVYFNPIFIDKIAKNPFNLDERTFPVDMGSAREETHNFTIELPEGVKVISKPKNIKLSIPEGAAKYVYQADVTENILSVTQQLSLNKAIYTTDEYFYLKELFSRAIQHLKIDYNILSNHE